MTDIVERLREAGQYGSDNDGELMRHAADEIERLRADVERLLAAVFKLAADELVRLRTDTKREPAA